jgi:hypothetical protein
VKCVVSRQLEGQKWRLFLVMDLHQSHISFKDYSGLRKQNIDQREDSDSSVDINL